MSCLWEPVLFFANKFKSNFSGRTQSSLTSLTLPCWPYLLSVFPCALYLKHLGISPVAEYHNLYPFGAVMLFSLTSLYLKCLYVSGEHNWCPLLFPLDAFISLFCNYSLTYFLFSTHGMKVSWMWIFFFCKLIFTTNPWNLVQQYHIIFAVKNILDFSVQIDLQCLFFSIIKTTNLFPFTFLFSLELFTITITIYKIHFLVVNSNVRLKSSYPQHHRVPNVLCIYEMFS